MTSGLTVKSYRDQVTYDIHVNHTACSGFSNYTTGPKEAIFHLFKYYVEQRNQWAEDTYCRYLKGHKVIAAMTLVGWVDD